MANKQTLYGTDTSKLVELLNVGVAQLTETDCPLADGHKADFLRDQLAFKLPETTPSESNAIINDYVSALIDSAMNKSISHYLFDETTPLSILKKIKAYGAQCSRNACSDTEKESANVIYYAAIAAALIHKEQRITTFTCNELAASFTTLMNLDWITTALYHHFRQARATCKALTTKKDLCD
jgi:hypothetical protein